MAGRKKRKRHSGKKQILNVLNHSPDIKSTPGCSKYNQKGSLLETNGKSIVLGPCIDLNHSAQKLPNWATSSPTMSSLVEDLSNENYDLFPQLENSTDTVDTGGKIKISRKQKRKSEVESLFDNLAFIYGKNSLFATLDHQQEPKTRKAKIMRNTNAKIDTKTSIKSKNVLQENIGRNVNGLCVTVSREECHQLNSKMHAKHVSAGKILKKKPSQKKETTKVTSNNMLEVQRKRMMNKKLSLGDLVIGDIKSFGWWYGKIVKHDKKPATKNLVWVYWFGDHKTLEFPSSYLKSYTEFPNVFNHLKMKKPIYKKAVGEFIDEIKCLHKRLLLPLPGLHDVPKRKHFYQCLKWALDGFSSHSLQDVKKVTKVHPVEKLTPNQPEMCDDSLVMTGTVTKTSPVVMIDGRVNITLDQIFDQGSMKDKNVKEISKRFSKRNKRKVNYKMQELHKNNAIAPNLKRKRSEELNKQPANQKQQRQIKDAVMKNVPKLTALKFSVEDNKNQDKFNPTLDTVMEVCEEQDAFYSAIDDSITEDDGNRNTLLSKITCQAMISKDEDKEVAVMDNNEQEDYYANEEERSCSTVFYDTEIETKIEEELKKDLYLCRKNKFSNGGIELDFKLLGTTPKKRNSSLKATDAFTSKRKKVKHVKQHSVVRKLSNTINLPIATSQSKVLTWDFNPPTTIQREIEPYKTTTTIKVNDLIIGKLAGFDWWFGKVISHKRARKEYPLDGMCWVYWYGDHKLSQMSITTLEFLDNFHLRFLPRKMKGKYYTAVYEILNEAAKRSSKDDLPDESKDLERLKELITWALDGFKPTGIHGLHSIDNTMEDVNNNDKSSSSSNGVLDDDLNVSNMLPALSDDVKLLFDKVAAGITSIEDLCLACGDTKVFTEHPLFEGGLCKECKDTFMESAFLYDTDGSQMYCCICSDGDHIILCDKVGCSRSYCPVCIDMLCGVGYAEKISIKAQWHCFMCVGKNVRLLKIRNNWQDKVKEIFNQDEFQMNFGSQVFYDPIPHDLRKPIRVLALFDGIATACFVLKKLELEIELYIGSEIDPDANKVSQAHHGNNIRHVGDICKITRADIVEWGPFDLVVGGSPCNDLSIANPARKGIYEGTGRLFFEFFRILQYTMPILIESRPFFWLFENVVGMRHIDKEVISRFLQCNPVVVSAKEVSAQHRNRYFWGNLPGMNRPLCSLRSGNLNLQDCLEPNCGRVAKYDKVRCITTMRHSLRQTSKSCLPVELNNSPTEQKEDELWVTEIERIFGFPEHYTDIGNMGQRQRQKLLGKSWSVPVIEHLLMPLKDYFKCNDRRLHENYAHDVQTQTYVESEGPSIDFQCNRSNALMVSLSLEQQDVTNLSSQQEECTEQDRLDIPTVGKDQSAAAEEPTAEQDVTLQTKKDELPLLKQHNTKETKTHDSGEEETDDQMQIELNSTTQLPL